MSGTIQVRLPDGSLVAIATDDPQAAAAAARKHWANKNTSTLDDWKDNLIDNVTPNWADEIAGIGGGIGSFVTGRGWSQGFNEAQQRTLERQAAYKKNHPIAHATSATAGTAASLVLPAGRALEGASLGRKALQGAKVGGAYGVISGAGEGEGLDLGRRATNASSSGAYGAGTGGVLPFAAAGTQRLGRAAREYIPGVDYVARNLPRVPRAIIQAATKRPQPPVLSAGAQQANRLAARTMGQGRIVNGRNMSGIDASPSAIRDEVARRNAQGVPAVLGDITEPMRGLTNRASRGAAPARQRQTTGQDMVKRVLADRKATEATRVRQHIRETMPTVDDPIAFLEQQQRSAKQAAAPLYQEAYQKPVYRSAPIQAIEQTPAFRDALPQAYRNVRNQIDEVTGLPKVPNAMGFRDMPNIDPNGLPPNFPYFPHPDGRGYVAVDDGLSFEGYDQVTRAMRDAGEAAGTLNPLTGRVRDNGSSVHINARANDLRGHLRSQNSAYDQAVGRYGDDMTYTNAFEQGGEVGTLTGHEVNAQHRALPEQAREAWATGAGTAMADAASQYGARVPNGDTANHVRQMLGDDIKQGAIGEMGGNTGGVQALQDRLDAESQGHLNWQAVDRSARSASRQGLDEMGGGGVPTSMRGGVRQAGGLYVGPRCPSLPAGRQGPHRCNRDGFRCPLRRPSHARAERASPAGPELRRPPAQVGSGDLRRLRGQRRPK
ncbi:hypothetical protein KRR38_25110 [Novosphingobium sp. G106]|uniref:hypothetical protein n=1 Tax=Novosphingobium sp. G106 TaxID=2849500 RepID=UPI001C2D2401|nr:hypothetical protein [Novosphingobium sp. G106]MBV1690868.1 hypothetical protein [Novosphingobium sp. G106]